MAERPPVALHGDAEAATMPLLLASWNERFGDLLAIADSRCEASFSELYARSERVACALLAAGVPKGARVGILMPNGAEYLQALFGVWRIGAVAVLISTLSRPPELAHVLRHADVDVLLAADRYLRNNYVHLLEEAVPELAQSQTGTRIFAKSAPFLRAVWLWGEARPRWARPAAEMLGCEAGMPIPAGLLEAAEQEVTPADPALIIYTSGSSASPKEVVHSQASLALQARSLGEMMAGCGEGDRLLSTMPFFWVGGLCTVVLAAFESGAAVLCPADPTPQATIACARDQDATHIMHWPQQIDLMKDDPEFARLLAKMRPAYPHQLETFGLAAPEENPNTLGMTETLGPHSMARMAPLAPDQRGSFGKAIGGIEHRIIDPDTGAVLPVGETGQLCLRGGALMIGMHRMRHEEVFDREGFYRTDDLASLDEQGHLYFAGRRGDVVKIAGTNVSPLEVEAVLRQLPGIKAACVVALRLEEGHELVLAAALIPEDGALLYAAGIRDQLRARLSSYKVPRYFVTLRETDLPISATSKILRPPLADLLRGHIRSNLAGTA